MFFSITGFPSRGILARSSTGLPSLLSSDHVRKNTPATLYDHFIVTLSPGSATKVSPSGGRETCPTQRKRKLNATIEYWVKIVRKKIFPCSDNFQGNFKVCKTAELQKSCGLTGIPPGGRFTGFEEGWKVKY